MSIHEFETHTEIVETFCEHVQGRTVLPCKGIGVFKRTQRKVGERYGRGVRSSLVNILKIVVSNQIR